MQGAQGIQGVQGFQGLQGQSTIDSYLYVSSFTHSGSTAVYVQGSTFSFDSNTKYMIEMIGYWRTNNSSGNPGFGMSSSIAGPTSSWSWRRQETTAPTQNLGYGSNGNTAIGAATSTANTDLPYLLEASLITGESTGFFGMIIASTTGIVTIKELIIRIDRTSV